MGKALTTEEFIQKAKKIHGDKYDYSRSSYQGEDLWNYKKEHMKNVIKKLLNI